MQWWGWFTIAAILLGAEMMFIDAQFYLVFFAVSAAVMGLAGLLGLELSPWLQAIAFALLSLTVMVTFRRRVYEKIRKPAGAIEEPVRAGHSVTLVTPLEPGQSGRVEYRGSTWTARNSSTATLSGEVEIAEVEGLTLHVRPRS